MAENIISFFIRDFSNPMIEEKKIIKEETVIEDLPAFMMELTRENVCRDFSTDFNDFGG